MVWRPAREQLQRREQRRTTGGAVTVGGCGGGWRSGAWAAWYGRRRRRYRRDSRLAPQRPAATAAASPHLAARAPPTGRELKATSRISSGVSAPGGQLAETRCPSSAWKSAAHIATTGAMASGGRLRPEARPPAGTLRCLGPAWGLDLHNGVLQRCAGQERAGGEVYGIPGSGKAGGSCGFLPAAAAACARAMNR